MGADPAGQILCRESLGVGVVACSQNGYENLSLQHFPSIAVDDVYGLPGKIHEHLLPGPVAVSKDRIELFYILSILLGKIAVLIAVGVLLFVLVP